MIEIKNVTKAYSEKKGNFDLSISIKPGSIYGVLGPNGAGKTTLIKQVLGFTKPDSGTIVIDNLEPFKNSNEIMKFTGYVPGELALFEGLKGIDFLKLVANIKGNAEWEFVEKLIEHFELDPTSKIKKMSKGMKQKLAIIAATMNKPKLLILDEPTSGLDPVMQRQFNELILILKNEYKSSVLMCSHIFEEVAELCDRICFIKDGRMIKEFDITKNDLKMINDEFNKLYERKKVL